MLQQSAGSVAIQHESESCRTPQRFSMAQSSSGLSWLEICTGGSLGRSAFKDATSTFMAYLREAFPPERMRGRSLTAQLES